MRFGSNLRAIAWPRDDRVIGDLRCALALLLKQARDCADHVLWIKRFTNVGIKTGGECALFIARVLESGQCDSRSESSVFSIVFANRCNESIAIRTPQTHI